MEIPMNIWMILGYPYGLETSICLGYIPLWTLKLLNGHVAGTSQCLVPEIAIIGWLVIWILWFLLVQAWFCGHSTTSCVWKGFVWRWSLSQNRWLEYARMIEPYMSQVCPVRFLIWGGKFLICKHPEIESPYTQRLLVIPPPEGWLDAAESEWEGEGGGTAAKPVGKIGTAWHLPWHRGHLGELLSSKADGSWSSLFSFLLRPYRYTEELDRIGQSP